MHSMRGVIKRIFSNMAAPMISRENARCAFLLILSLLAMIKMIPVLKTPFKESFWLHAAHAVLKRVFSYARHTESDKREF